MAHGIMEKDRGFVSGVKSTWHKMAQYICFADRAITIDEAMSVARYPLEKRRLEYANPDGAFTQVDAWAVVRSDHNITLVDHVGKKFVAMGNEQMVHFLNEGLLCIYPELHIESVGTLGNGATFFISMKVDERQVKGDKSPTATSLLFENPLGKGAYRAFAHTERVLCKNTLRIAESEGLANQSMKKFGHFSGAKEKISEHLIDMAKMKLCIDSHFELLNHLSGQMVSDNQVNQFLDKLFPIPLDEGRIKTAALKSRGQFLNIFDGVQTETLDNPHTRYGLLQAYTDWSDHVKSARGLDDAAIIMDGLSGGRGAMKQKVLSILK